MGSPKALLDIDGRPSVEVVIDLLRGAGAGEVLVVVGKHAAETRKGADLSGVTVVDHREWDLGRTSSIQKGLAAVPAHYGGALLANVDQPLVLPETVAAVVTAFRESDADVEFVSPVFGRRFGHPVVLARSLFERFMELDPAHSPRALLRTARRVEVSVDDTGILVDLDRPSDLTENAGDVGRSLGQARAQT